MTELKLYYRPMCPFCRKVLAFMEENNISLELVDITGNAQANEDLMDTGGKTQVPCLLIDGKPLYESDDIIQWLRDNS